MQSKNRDSKNKVRNSQQEDNWALQNFSANRSLDQSGASQLPEAKLPALSREGAGRDSASAERAGASAVQRVSATAWVAGWRAAPREAHTDPDSGAGDLSVATRL